VLVVAEHVQQMSPAQREPQARREGNLEAQGRRKGEQEGLGPGQPVLWDVDDQWLLLQEILQYKGPGSGRQKSGALRA
jgi:hypothetical protein